MNKVPTEVILDILEKTDLKTIYELCKSDKRIREICQTVGKKIIDKKLRYMIVKTTFSDLEEYKETELIGYREKYTDAVDFAKSLTRKDSKGKTFFSDLKGLRYLTPYKECIKDGFMLAVPADRQRLSKKAREVICYYVLDAKCFQQLQ